MVVMYNGKTLRENCEEMGLVYRTVMNRRGRHPFQNPADSLVEPRSGKGGRNRSKYFTERGTKVSALYEKYDYDRICRYLKRGVSYADCIKRITIVWDREKFEAWCKRHDLDFKLAFGMLNKGFTSEDIYLQLSKPTLPLVKWCEREGIPYYEALNRMQKNPKWTRGDLIEYFESSDDFVLFEGKWELALGGIPIRLLFDDECCKLIARKIRNLRFSKSPNGRVVRAVELLKKKGWKFRELSIK